MEKIKARQHTSVYQLNTENWNMAEFNLAGLVLKRTDFSEVFQHHSILAVDDTHPRYLLTPIGKKYMDVLFIVEITNEHEVLESP